jgi:hypothetical protein
MLLRSHTVGQQGINVASTVPKVETIKLRSGAAIALGLDFEFESRCQMGFGRNMGQKVRDIGELWILDA